MQSFINRILQGHQSFNNYGLFLASLVLLTIFPIFNTLLSSYSLAIFRFTYTMVILFGTYTVTSSWKHLSLGISLGFLALASYWGSALTPIGESGFNMIPNFFGICFFLFIGLQLYRSISQHRSIDINVIYGTIIGYLILGIIGGQCCILLDQIAPGSFSAVDIEQSPYQYYYFSFVCLTTVGFGDITPASDGARSLALLISLSGQLYLTVIIALIIGKFLSRQS